MNGSAGNQFEELIETIINNWWESTLVLKVDSEQCSLKSAFVKLFLKVIANEEKLSSSIKNYKLFEETINQFNNDRISYEKRISGLERLISLQQEENKGLRKEFEQLKRQPITQPPAKSYEYPPILNSQPNNFSSSLDQTIETFNMWAQNPALPLPVVRFCYAEGDLKLREKQNIQYPSTNDDASWIVNKTGSTKYLFPNPNSIDQLSGKIDNLYTVMGSRRAQGHNKVKIQKPCIIKEDGWIEYKGELTLI